MATLNACWKAYQKARNHADKARDELREAVAAEIKSGTSEADLARRLGTSRTTVRGLLGKRKRYPSAG